MNHRAFGAARSPFDFVIPSDEPASGEESRDLLLTFPQRVPPEKIILGLWSGAAPVGSALELRMLEPRRGGDGVSPGRSKPGSPIRAAFARIGVGSGVLGRLVY